MSDTTLRTTVFAIRLISSGVATIRQVAKLMRAPANGYAPEISGKGIIYKIIRTGVHTMNKSQTLGVDKDAWEACRKGGAEYVVFWVRDINNLLVAKCSDFISKGSVEDYGEGEQLHLSMDHFTVHDCNGCGTYGPLQTVYIPEAKWVVLKDVEKVAKARPEKRTAVKPAKDKAEQAPSLF